MRRRIGRWSAAAWVGVVAAVLYFQHDRVSRYVDGRRSAVLKQQVDSARRRSDEVRVESALGSPSQWVQRARPRPVRPSRPASSPNPHPQVR